MFKHICNTENSGIIAVLVGGPPASGKGTQAKILGGLHISSGDLARKKRSVDVEFENKYGELMDLGHYIPDEIVLQLIHENASIVEDFNGYVIYDGAFRSHQQATKIGSVIARPGLAISFHITISWEVALERARIRYKKEVRTDDADEASLRVRFKEWERHDKAVQGKLKSQGVKVYVIDGERSIEEVNAEIRSLLQKHEHWIRKKLDKRQKQKSFKPCVSMVKNMKLEDKKSRMGTRRKREQAEYYQG